MQQTLKKISIIIPCYNAERFIVECIESVFQQNYHNIEIIVVDDGSTDKSVEKLTPYLDRITLIKQENQGACVARNRGLDIATGDFIKFLDADDYLAEGILLSQANKLESLDDFSIVFGNLIQKHPDRTKLRTYHTFDNNKMVETLILTGVVTTLPLHRIELLKKVGGFDPRFKNGQEWNMHIRLAASGIKFIYESELVYYQRFHDGEDRISNQKAVTDWDYQIQKRLMTLESISKITPLTESIKQAMAFNVWNLGRRAMVQDDTTAAEKCFATSKEIEPNIAQYLSLPHRILSLLIGKVATEHLTYARKRFTKWRKRLLQK